MLNGRILTDREERRILRYAEKSWVNGAEKVYARAPTQDRKVLILDDDRGEENINSAPRRSREWVSTKSPIGVTC